jgi:hypothetical protein
MKNKRAALGDYIDLIYRVALISITVAIIFGTYTFAFAPSVDIKDSEAVILQKKLYNCFNKDNSFDLELFENSNNKIFESCSIEIGELDSGRYSVKLVHLDDSDNLVKAIKSVDSGKLWVQSMIENEDKTVKNEKNKFWNKYSLGFSNMTYSILNEGNVEKLNIEVWVNEI